MSVKLEEVEAILVEMYKMANKIDKLANIIPSDCEHNIIKIKYASYNIASNIEAILAEHIL